MGRSINEWADIIMSSSRKLPNFWNRKKLERKRVRGGERIIKREPVQTSVFHSFPFSLPFRLPVKQNKHFFRQVKSSPVLITNKHLFNYSSFVLLSILSIPFHLILSIFLFLIKGDIILVSVFNYFWYLHLMTTRSIRFFIWLFTVIKIVRIILLVNS